MSLNTILATAPLTATGYHLKATGTALGQSLIWDNGTNVGIGNTNTSYTFDVTGTGRFTGALQVGGNASSTITIGDAVASGTDANLRLRTGSTKYAWLIASQNNIAGFEITPSTTVGGTTFSTPALSILPTGAATFSSPNSVIANNQGIKIYSTDSQAADLGGGISFGGYYVGTSTTADFANIKSGKDNSTSGNYAGYLSFSTNAQATGNVERMRITSGGAVGIGTAGQAAVKLEVKGDGTGATNYAALFTNSSSQDLFYIRTDGVINTGTRALSPYNNGFTGRTMQVFSNGELGYLSSIRESKGNIESIDNVSFINQLNPVSFNYRKKDKITNQYTDELVENKSYGFIADEVEKVNKDLVFYDIQQDGTKKLAGVEYNNMIAILTKAIQELSAKIEQLENK
jgi:hypothetical protein